MSFFTLSDGNKAEVKTSYEVEGFNDEPIPHGSVLLAVITEAKWEEHDGVWHINLRWDVVGKEYTKRVIFHKVRVEDTDPKKADRAKMMLLAIDANAGGHLAKLKDKPNDQDLQKLCNRKMSIMVSVWSIKDEQTGETKKGNWVNMVGSVEEGAERIKRMGGNPKPEKQAPAAPVKKEAPAEVSDDADDELPF